MLTGRLPTGADAAVWRTLLQRELRAQRRGRRVRRPAIGALAGWVTVVLLEATLVLLVACAAGLALVIDRAWVGVVLAVAVLAIGGRLGQGGRRRERQVRRLLDRVPIQVPPAD